MASIRITTTVEIIRADGYKVSTTETTENLASGDNPRFFAGDVDRGMADIHDRAVKTITNWFGDVREHVPA